MGARTSKTGPARPKGVSSYARVPEGEDKADKDSLRILPRKKKTGSKASFYGHNGNAPAYTRSRQTPLGGISSKKTGAPASYVSRKDSAGKTAKAKGEAASAPSATRSGLSIAPGYIILWSFILGICGYVYITHVFTTQRMLTELNEARQQLDRAQIIHEDRMLQLERISGPAEVLSRARSMGLENHGPPEFLIEPQPPQSERRLRD